MLDKHAMWGEVNEVQDLPKVLVDRLRHYFSIYKSLTHEDATKLRIDRAYGCEQALKLI